MGLKIIKRNGKIGAFSISNIIATILKAAKDMKISNKTVESLENVYNAIVEQVEKNATKEKTIQANQVYDIVIKQLKNIDKELYCRYVNEYNKKAKEREKQSELMSTINKIGIETDRDNANVGNNFSSKLLRIASESNKRHNTIQMPEHLSKLHENGDLYYHDQDSFNLTINCLNVDTGKVLREGFNTGYGTINPPKRIESAAELSCILLQSTQNDMFGGQAHTNFDIDLASFVDMTRQEIKKEEILNAVLYDSKVESSVGEIYLSDLTEKQRNLVLEKTEHRVIKKVHQAMQAIIYNLNTMHARAGQMWAVLN